MYVYVCMCVYVCMYVFMYVCMCMYVCMYWYTFASVVNENILVNGCHDEASVRVVLSHTILV